MNPAIIFQLKKNINLHMKKLFLAASFVGLLSVSCTPKSTATTEAPKSVTSTAEQIAQERLFMKMPAKDVTTYLNLLDILPYNGWE